MRRPHVAWIAAASALLAPVLVAAPVGGLATPSIELVIIDHDVAEGAAVGVAVVLDAPAGRDVTVRLDTRAGSAQAPGDYGAVHRRVTVPAGERIVRLAIPTADDDVDEGPEDLVVRLSRPHGAELGHRRDAVRIRDRDPAPRARVLGATFTEPTLGHRLGFTEVLLSAPSGRRVVVELLTRDGTATAGQDFVRLRPTAVFAPGQTSATVSVELLSDSRAEPPETLRLAVTRARHVRGTRGATITILDQS